MSAIFIVKPELAKLVGFETAGFFHRIEYWISKSGKKIDNNEWIYNSLEEWQRQFSFWSISKIRRIINSLKKHDLILTKKINSKCGNHVMWYAINLKTLHSIVGSSNLAPPSPPLKSSAKNNTYHHNSRVPYICSKRTNGIVQNEQILNKTISNSKLYNSSSIVESQIESNRFEFSEEEISQLKIIWKKVFAKNTLPCSLTKDRIKQLESVWEPHFESSFKKWEVFCTKICSSRFLMGEKTSFKANLSWLLKEDTILRVFEDEFEIGDRSTDQEQIVFKKSLKEKTKTQVQKKLKDLESIQTEQQKRSEWREKEQALERLSERQRSKLTCAFQSSKYYQEKITEWKLELSKTDLGKLYLETASLPSKYIERLWMQDFLKDNPNSIPV